MKIQRFSLRLGLGFVLVGLLLPMQPQSAQAQVSPAQDSDYGKGGFDGGNIAPGLVIPPSVRLAIPRLAINEYVRIAFSVINLLRAGNYSGGGIPPTSTAIQQNLAIVLTSPTPEAINFVVAALVSADVSEAEAITLVNSIAGLFTEVEQASLASDNGLVSVKTSSVLMACRGECQISQLPEGSTEEDLQQDIPLRVDQAERLVAAVNAYNTIVSQLELEALRNSSSTLLLIRSVLLGASEGTR